MPIVRFKTRRGIVRFTTKAKPWRRTPAQARRLELKVLRDFPLKRRNPTVCFRTKSGKKITFKARKTASPARASCRTKSRKGSWPKGKVPKHLKKYLFR